MDCLEVLLYSAENRKASEESGTGGGFSANCRKIWAEEKLQASIHCITKVESDRNYEKFRTSSLHEYIDRSPIGERL